MLYIISVIMLIISLCFAYRGGRIKNEQQGWRNIFLALIYMAGAIIIALSLNYFGYC